MIKKVRIVATVGPASESREVLTQMVEHGVNVFRLNLSHKESDEIIKNIKDIRSVESKLKTTVTIMGDLGGPKIRTSIIDEEAEVKTGDLVEISDTPVAHGTPQNFSLNFRGIVKNLEIGAEIYLNDGMPKLQVIKKTPTGITAKVVAGGIIKSRMGFSAQGLAMENFVFTDKDKRDLKTVVENGADSVAVSFVQRGQDIDTVRKLMPKNKRKMIIAKIETLEAVKNIEEILETADGIMIARGDLGFAVPLGEIPHIQKRLIHLALKYAKPVITATQMLESMTHNQLPTRAEITDVANAILEGTDAVMLSGETARGKYPVQVIDTMVKIIQGALPRIPAHDFPEAGSVTDAVSASVIKVAEQLKARLIVVFTHNGPTARRISRHRGNQIILALTPFDETIHRLNFTWGIKAVKVKNIKNFDDFLSQARKIAAKNNYIKLKKGEPYVISAGVPFGKAGATNMVVVQRNN